ncbi:flagellar biosynthesis anti-sigma factor FlgM [Bacillus sp. 31A1R]|uniref:Negative regulator of flagellin synthesis n=1 Tax=Robertmurraya mangrovi TaxID=3098077 RepID=A0ABU5IXR5_9BACI|nr:flagellar biosynthesis anti-sigma factor FlgM [Bacillus sp. 31A1R]MDZ5471950.1 flagellar biosynthesis anti-sigma factor FlgM [Bacillus sp. 31A1R]
MKINNIGRLNVNPYNKQIEKSETVQKSGRKDKIEISNEALELQKIGQIEIEREAKVKEIKEKISSGEYEVNNMETAKKLYDFWNNRF